MYKQTFSYLCPVLKLLLLEFVSVCLLDMRLLLIHVLSYFFLIGVQTWNRVCLLFGRQTW